MVVRAVEKGVHSTFLAYGQTGSGKTHSTTGGRGNLRGLIPRVLDDVMVALRTLEAGGGAQSFSVHLGALEVYKEVVRDLMHPDQKAFARPAKPGGVRKEISTAKQGLAILAETSQHRTVAKTLMNTESSRSHMVLSIFIKVHTDDVGGTPVIRDATISIVDLAGSENLEQSGTAGGGALAEAVKINQSLRALTHFLALVGKASQPGGKKKKVTMPRIDSSPSFL